MRRSILLLPACLAFAAISGCGNKGPLYYPPAAPKPAPVKPAPAPAPAHASTAAQPASSSSVVTKPLSGN
jgi:predicted small lipoprotein YifL